MKRFSVLISILFLLLTGWFMVAPTPPVQAQTPTPVPTSNPSLTWALTGNMHTPRWAHSLTLLSNGKVLVAGGIATGNVSSNALTSAEIYDPFTGEWIVTGNMNVPRSSPQATLLPNGKVLIVGGGSGGNNTATAELYDPVTEQWSLTGSLNTARHGNLQVLLPNGKVLVAGGYEGSNLTSSELYDPATGTWSLTGSLNVARHWPDGTLLPNGKVLIIRGEYNASTTGFEIYDPTTGQWTLTTGSNLSYYGYAMTLLQDGKLLTSGGLDRVSLATQKTSFVHDPNSIVWTATGNLNVARYGGSMLLLPHGEVMMIGGIDSGQVNSNMLASTEFYNPTSQTWRQAANLKVARYYVPAVILPDSRVLIAGGIGNGNTILDSAELYGTPMATPTPTNTPTPTATATMSPQTFTCANVSEIPQSECNALVALYNSTGGANWITKTNWLVTNTPCSWYGLTCNSGHVATLYLYDNRLVGSVPSELSNLSSLQKIWLSGNQLNGTVLSTLSQMPSLTYINLFNNQLSETLLPELGSLTNLTYLNLGSNQFSGNIPAQFGNLTNLVTLNLGTNKLSGIIPPELGNLSHLASLTLSSNQLSGIIPLELGDLSNLASLTLSSNQLSGIIPPELGNLSQLQLLYLSNNPLSGSIPPELGNLIQLRDLRLTNNQLSGAIPAELGNLINLKFLHADKNALTGSIPLTLGNLSNLVILDFTTNKLSGVIPSELGNLANLEYLYLGSNQLSESIPLSFGNLTHLKNIYINANKLTGPVPTWLGTLPNLEKVSFSGNQLTGNIPVEIGQATHLQQLALYSNNLSGTVPKELGQIITLTELYLSINSQLVGQLPDELTNLKNLDLLWVNQTGLCVPNTPAFQTWLQGIATTNPSYANTPWCANIINGNFEQGLTAWQQAENATITTTGRTGNGVAISYDGGNSDLIQVLPITLPANTSWRATAWCNAPIGTMCRLYLGDAGPGITGPNEHFNSIERPGTGNWQELNISVSLGQDDERMSVYLYSSSSNSVVVYDDVSVEQIFRDDSEISNGGFENRNDFWFSLDNTRLIPCPMRSGTCLEVNYDDPIRNSDAIQIVRDIAHQNETWQVSVACLADVGNECQVFMGDVYGSYNLPIYENFVDKRITGTGQWQYITGTLTLTRDEQLSVWVYGRGGTAIYDDVKVEKVNITTVGTCNDPTQFKGEYFANDKLVGNPSFVRCDNAIDFAWASINPPHASIPSGQPWGVRWTKDITFTAGTYTFTTLSDDGVRLYIDNELVIDNWTAHSITPNVVSKFISSGQHTVKLDYFDIGVEGSGAIIKLSWELNPASFTCGDVSEIPATECNALVALYNSTGGANWITKTNWLVTNQPCGWYHVTCSNGHVANIDISNNNAQGTFPDLHAFTQLKQFGAVHAKLDIFPNWIGDISTLEYLNLGGTGITGPLPSSIGALNLTVLSIGNTNMESPLPAEFCNLTNLIDLHLSLNPKFQGELPSCLTSFTKMQAFHYYSAGWCVPNTAAFQTWLQTIPNLSPAYSDTPWCQSAPSLAVSKTANKQTVKVGEVLTYTLVITASGLTQTARLTDTLPIGLELIPTSLPTGFSYDATSRQLRYLGLLNGVVTFTYQAKVGSGLGNGSMLYNSVELTVPMSQTLQWRGDAATVVIPDPTFKETIVVVDIGVDNNLDKAGTEALIRLRQACQQNSKVKCLVLVDWRGANNAYLYNLGDAPLVTSTTCPNAYNTTCGGAYQIGKNMWTWDEHSTSAYSVAELLMATRWAYPNAKNVDQLILSLIGHGGGFSSETALPGLLMRKEPQPINTPQVGGLLWEENPLDAMSVASLQEALSMFHQESGQTIGLLYLDMCSMSMLEVVDELGGLVNYVLASENWAWAIFPYDQHIKAIDGQKDARAIGQAWFANQVQSFSTESNYPYTFSLLDMTYHPLVMRATNTLAETLLPYIETQAGRAQLAQLRQQADCFDSNQDGQIDSADSYCDLGSLAVQAQSVFSSDLMVKESAAKLLDSLKQFVIAESHRGGVPPSYPNSRWSWSNQVKGLSIFAPFLVDSPKRTFYDDYNLKFAEHSLWNELVNGYYNITAPTPCTTCTMPLAALPPADFTLAITSSPSLVKLSWPVTTTAAKVYTSQPNVTQTMWLTTTQQNSYIDYQPIPNGCYQVKIGEKSSTVACNTSALFGLTLPEQAVSPNDDVIVGVRLNNAAGVCPAAMNLAIQYDPTIAELIGIQPTVNMPNARFETKTSQPGLARIASITSHCVPIYGSGNIALLKFRIKGQVGQITPLKFLTGVTNTSLFDNADLYYPLDMALTHGSLKIDLSYILGDLNGNGTVEAADALLTLQIDTGKATPTLEQRQACDTNGDGLCNAADATLTLCYAAKQNWSTCQQKYPSRRQVSVDPVQVCVSPIKQAGENRLRVKLNNATEMAGITLAFTTSQIELKQIAPSTLTQDFVLDSYLANTGVLQVALANDNAVNDDGLLFELVVTAKTPTATVILTKARLNNASGQDFVTQLQREIEITTCKSENNLYLPLMVKDKP